MTTLLDCDEIHVLLGLPPPPPLVTCPESTCPNVPATRKHTSPVHLKSRFSDKAKSYTQMPSHRRFRSAAKLPHDRLPLGTHLPGKQSARPTSQATDYSDSSRRPSSEYEDASSDIEPIAKPAKPATSTEPNITTMSNSGYDSEPPHLTTAEDKLRRQEERIQASDPLLAVHSHLDRSRPQSRAKGKTRWEPLDIAWDTAEPPQQTSERTTPPVSQVRINTYSAFMPPPLPREISLSRSMSSVSAQTNADADRNDSFFDNSGFQTYRRRGVKAEELKPYEDKPEEKQRTVEASFDKRAVYEVFGAELPTLEYMNSIVGAQDGQLQFAQHPNGDVSAHLWSYERFGWQNIGSFSNIRKKTEGQLGRDRLRGETASQTLQKNTLAYFRAIAKQREYNARGIEFGQAEIQQLLPASEGKVPSFVTAQESFSSVSGSSDDSLSFDQSRSNDVSQPVPSGPRSATLERFELMQEQTPQSQIDDPFTSAAPYSGTYGSTATTSTKAGMSAPLFTSAPPPHRLPSDESRRTSAQKPSVPAVPKLFPLFIPKQGDVSGNSSNNRTQPSLGTVDTPLRQKASTPFETREAMRDHLLKLGESAQARSMSQAANNRTVLYDPLQGERKDSTGPSHDAQDEYSHYASSDEHNSFSQTKPADIYGLTPGQQWTPARSYQAPSGRDYTLQDSVPDMGLPFNMAPGTMVNSMLPRANDRIPSNPYDPSNWRDPDEELQEWWTSGNKHARQEDFYQSIKALAMSSTVDTSTPSSRPRPIGAPALLGTPSARSTATPVKNKTAEPPFDEGITRVLIPVYENLASYVQGPVDQRRDYWSRWSQPPEWCIDRGPNGNNSFFDSGWGQPPARVGRDPRYRPMPGELRFGGFSPGGPVSVASPRGGIPGFPYPRY